MNSGKILAATGVVCLALAGAATGQAIEGEGEAEQERRLADIRYELSELYFQLQDLRFELLQGQSDPELEPALSGNILQRIDSLEAELRANIASIEELEFRINSIAADGLRKIKMLESRLIAAEGGDPVALGDQTTLGADDGSDFRPEVALPQLDIEPTSDELFNDETLLRSALEHFEEGRFERATEVLDELVNQYPDSEFASEAQYYRGESLSAMGNLTDASRAFLASFVADDRSEVAAKSLYRLGQVFIAQAKSAEGCRMLNHVVERFPESDEAAHAGIDIGRFNCREYIRN